MMKFILSIFGIRTGVSRIQALSEQALVGFNKTLRDLRHVDGEIAAQHARQEKVIKDAEAAKLALVNHRLSNNKIIGKLEEFLS